MLNQTTGAQPQKTLRFRSNCHLTMEDVREMRNDLMEACRNLLCVADDHNCYSLQMAGRSIGNVIESVLDGITDEAEKGGEE